MEQQVLRWMPPPDMVDHPAIEMRTEYQQTGSPEAIRGLLARCVEQGMSPGEVSEILGEPGQRVYDDGWITNDGGVYQVGDEAYKWGPDGRGTSYFLVFRDRRLVNFDPAQFE